MFSRGPIITFVRVALAFISCAATCVFAQDEGKRVALIIGNNNYSVSALKNAVNDARLLDKSLRAAGFKTILKEDASATAMEEAAASFAGQLGPDDTALFFYAGHGVQIENENFLVPIDFEPSSSIIQAKFKCFRLGQLLEELKKHSKRCIVILDACRSNPVATSHGLQGGLAQPQLTGTETFVAFSTGPGQVAADNPNGRDSWFTEALADLIDQPALTLDDVFTRVKSRVAGETDKHQVPWTQSSLTTTFYFHPPDSAKGVSDPTAAEKWLVEAQLHQQRQEWNRASELISRIIERKPGGALEETAKSKQPYLLARAEAETKFEESNFAQASQAYEKALHYDPFATDAAFGAANSYLLAGQIPETVKQLKIVRMNGTSDEVAKANAMLKELGAVYPEAAQVARMEFPAPPSLSELFKDQQFGAPDWEAGVRSAKSAPLHVDRWTKALSAAFPPPTNPTDDLAQSVQIAKDVFHVEISSTSRDITLRSNATVPEGEKGSLFLMGPQDAGVVANGAIVASHLPFRLTLSAGTYEVKGVHQGQVVTSKTVEVVAGQTKTFTVQANQ